MVDKDGSTELCRLHTYFVSTSCFDCGFNGYRLNLRSKSIVSDDNHHCIYRHKENTSQGSNALVELKTVPRFVDGLGFDCDMSRQCDQIGRFIKVFGNKFTNKISPNVWRLFALFKKQNVLSKNCHG